MQQGWIRFHVIEQETSKQAENDEEQRKAYVCTCVYMRLCVAVACRHGNVFLIEMDRMSSNPLLTASTLACDCAVLLGYSQTLTTSPTCIGFTPLHPSTHS